MGYIRAEDILPEEILALVQQYIDGQSIYIPRKAGCHKAWGAGPGTRSDLMIPPDKMAAVNHAVFQEEL